MLRGFAFYAHGVGTAAFPGLVLADGFAFSPPLGALSAALASLAALAAAAFFGRRWLALGFEPETARALGLRQRLLDALLLVLRCPPDPAAEY